MVLLFLRLVYSILTLVVRLFSGGNGCRKFGTVVLVVGQLFVFGCMVGPNYYTPDIPLPGSWNEELHGGITEDKTELANWWSAFDDATLDSLIERASQGNLGLQEAYARIQEARAQRGVVKAPLFPDIDAATSYQRNRSSGNSLGLMDVDQDDLDFYSGGFDAVWEVDLFGRIRRSIEAADADLQASAEDYRDILVTLYADVARNYIEVRSFQTRLMIAENNIKAQRQSLQLAKDRVEAGVSPSLDVAQATTNLADTESGVPGLQIGLKRALNRLAVLLGEHPGTLDEELGVSTSTPAPPKGITIGIPADLIRQRPDIRRAEWQLAAQTARVGIATADLYPALSLSGNFSFDASQFSDVFDWRSRTYGIGPSLRWNIFDAGKIRNNIRVEDARTEQSLIRYESTVLNALEDVENSLISYIQEQFQQESLKRASEAAEKSVYFSKILYKEGETDFQNVLDAQRSLLSFQSRLAESEGNVAINLISLYKALGGGWSTDSNEN